MQLYACGCPLRSALHPRSEQMRIQSLQGHHCSRCPHVPHRAPSLAACAGDVLGASRKLRRSRSQSRGAARRPCRLKRCAALCCVAPDRACPSRRPCVCPTPSGRGPTPPHAGSLQAGMTFKACNICPRENLAHMVAELSAKFGSG